MRCGPVEPGETSSTGQGEQNHGDPVVPYQCRMPSANRDNDCMTDIS